ncbi:hypothetical protein OC834_000473 [Tilletia horrida]|nr:hypothetical protein OC835_004646 [Tilletia horrida]KAK0538325.1 hypothetical protein OC834_000473 [Tilletia horrida]KAK0560499.1 hypothetical protein OC844_003725 [Tilletia horrida]
MSSFFARKLSGKTRSRSMTENQIKAITKDPNSKEILDREYASLRNTGRSKTNFRPVQHSTIAELDSFFGGTSSAKQAHDAAHRVKDQNTGQVWYDSIEQQEWRKLLQSGSSPGTPPSRRSSSTSFLASTPGGTGISNWPPSCAMSPLPRRRSMQSPLRGASEYDQGAPLSPLSELIGCYDHAPFMGASMVVAASPREELPGLGITRRERDTNEKLVVLPLMQSTLAGGPRTPSDNITPITLDLASSSPFVEERRAHAAAATAAQSPEQSRSGRRLLAALGLSSPSSPPSASRYAPSSRSPASNSSTSTSATKQARRLSLGYFPTSPLSKMRMRSASRVADGGELPTDPTSTASTAAELAASHQGVRLQPALLSPAAVPSSQETAESTVEPAAQPTATQPVAPVPTSTADMAASINALMMQTKTPVLQPAPSRVERSLRPRRPKHKRRRAAPSDFLDSHSHAHSDPPTHQHSLLRRTSSTGDLSISGATERVPHDDEPEARDFIRRATLALQRHSVLEMDRGAAARFGDEDEDGQSDDNSRPPSSAASLAPSSLYSSALSHSATTSTTTTTAAHTIRLPPMLPLFQRRFARLRPDGEVDEQQELQQKQAVQERRKGKAFERTMRPYTAGSL